MSNSTYKVLVVDDCDLTLRVIAKFLRSEGFLVSTASNGAEALEMVQDSYPDFVITDWQMPNVDGQMLCQCLRTAAFEKYMYLILMTAHSDMMNLVDGLGAGADDYITKPVNLAELGARMKCGARVLEMDRRLSYAAQHDPLTGVLNRRNLPDTMARSVKMCELKGAPISCIMLDVDHFKSVNDTHGHQVGDQVLINIAQSLSSRFRNADSVCRYGGEEFLIVLPECDEEGAGICAERCREEISRLTFRAGKESFQVSVSFGCAELGKDETAIDMIENADQALLAAKSRGRNNVMNFSNIVEVTSTLNVTGQSCS